MLVENARILVVDAGGGCELSRLLTRRELEVLTVSGLEQLDVVVATERPRAVVLDVADVRDSVLAACRRLRTRTDVGIVVVTVRLQQAAVLAAFDAGADAVLPSSIGRFELVARIRSLVRRSPLG